MTEPSHPIGRDLDRALRAYDAAIIRHMAESGHGAITLAEADVLDCIPDNGSTMGHIADQRGVSKQAIQGQIQSLMKRDYVALRPDPSDGRIKRVLRTQKGHDVVAALATAQSKVHSALEGKLGIERVKNMRNMLAQAQRALGL